LKEEKESRPARLEKLQQGLADINLVVQDEINRVRAWRVELNNCKTQHGGLDDDLPNQVNQVHRSVVKLEEEAYKLISDGTKLAEQDVAPLADNHQKLMVSWQQQKVIISLVDLKLLIRVSVRIPPSNRRYSRYDDGCGVGR
jgi:hypothetical protein